MIDYFFVIKISLAEYPGGVGGGDEGRGGATSTVNFESLATTFEIEVLFL